MKKLPFSQLALAIMSMCLLCFLSACTQQADANNNNNVPSATLPKATATTGAPKLQTYTAQYFTVGYPQSWQAQRGQGDTVIISYPAYKANFVVSDLATDSPDAMNTIQQHLDILLIRQHSDYNDFKTYPERHATIGGQAWTFVSWSGTNKNSGNKFKGTIGAATYKGKRYIMDYSSLFNDFDNVYNGGFKLMEDSFKFKN